MANERKKKDKSKERKIKGTQGGEIKGKLKENRKKGK